jgi:RNA-directed DNA polymerase
VDKKQKNDAENSVTSKRGQSDAVDNALPKRASLFATTPENENQIELMEEVACYNNLKRALKQVKRNKGSPGVDGMTVQELDKWLLQNQEQLRQELLTGTYRPTPVKRVEIPKPQGGTRKLGIPTVKDRLVQQAIMQVLQPRFEPLFSENSFGFRPERSAHDAVNKVKEYIDQGYGVVVDIDLEKFFDKVNHDILMGRIMRTIKDKRVLKLIRRFLQAGVLIDGLVTKNEEGTPQGGPLSPLLSNIMLTDLDRELERRGLKFSRYADDCNIYVKSMRAGLRVMDSVSRFIETKLKLRVNKDKSGVAAPSERTFLGFTFTRRELKTALSQKALGRFENKIREITRRKQGRSFENIMKSLNLYLNGWVQYFKIVEANSIFRRLGGWIRRRLRSYIWSQWRTPRARFRGLLKYGANIASARKLCNTRKRCWRTSRNTALHKVFPNEFFSVIGMNQLFS